ncbi:MAG: hydrolase [Bacteroidota bacterium]
MKHKIFLYLFVFAALIALFQFVSANNLQKALNEELDKTKAENKALKDSLQSARIDFLDQQYFTLENNDDALAYFDELPLTSPSNYVSDKLLETNEPKGDNPLVPYEGMQSDFKINKIKVINHRWLLADFSDGNYWGDLLVRYEVKEDLGVDFTVMDHLLYTRSH